MSANAELIRQLYESFIKRDGDTMAACYHEDAVFSDPVFSHLSGAEVGGMWKMFCARATDLELDYRDVRSEGHRGFARWDAIYTFSATGRRVHNRIEATFEFANGKIVRHTDDFDFYRWSRMALGPLGWALGWTPIVRRRVQSQAAGQLERFMAQERS